jgi:predicted cupin superfamily sugar epimerase
VITPEFLIERFKLQPLPIEGGLFHRYYFAQETIPTPALPERYHAAGPARRALGNAICYLHLPESCSLLHRLRTDEIYHFYLGDPVTMLLLYADGSHEVKTLGTELEAGQEPFLVVPRGAWQGSKLAQGGRWAFIGCSLAPAYDDSDFELGRRDELTREYPAAAESIRELTTDGWATESC